MKNNKTIILANGEFPKSSKVLDILRNAAHIVCCDGATQNLLNFGLKPSVIVGDMDSLSEKIQKEYHEKIIKNPEQNTNDLTKAINWCVDNKITDVIIIGATGKREDHTIANIALLGRYTKQLNVKIITDYGEFLAINETTRFKSYKGQQVSVFTITPNVEISSQGLKYPLKDLKLSSWWMGTLNESLGSEFTLSFKKKGIFIVYLTKNL